MNGVILSWAHRTWPEGLDLYRLQSARARVRLPYIRAGVIPKLGGPAAASDGDGCLYKRF